MPNPVPDVPTKLIEEFRRGNVILFAGAGVSKGYIENGTGQHLQDLPTWSDLLEILIDYGKQQGALTEAEWSELKELRKEQEYLMVAEIIRDKLNAGELREAMDQIFRQPSIKPNNRHKLITKIPFASVITTNYDKLLETAYTRLTSTNPDVYSFDDATDVIFSLRARRPFILKVHGQIEKLDSLILSESDYRRLLYREPAYVAALTSIFLTKTLLFIGTSLTDPDINWVLETVNEAFEDGVTHHYALVPRVSGPLKKRFREKFTGIRLIEYDPSPGHPEVDVFLEKLLAITQQENIENPFKT